MKDELAEDSDDEKRLFRAEARAGRKAKAAQAAKFKKRRSMASRKPQSSGMPASVASLNSQQLAQPQAWPQPATGRTAYSTAAPQSLGPCFFVQVASASRVLLYRTLAVAINSWVQITDNNAFGRSIHSNQLLSPIIIAMHVCISVSMEYLPVCIIVCL